MMRITYNIIIFTLTMVCFAILSFQGGAFSPLQWHPRSIIETNYKSRVGFRPIAASVASSSNLTNDIKRLDNASTSDLLTIQTYLKPPQVRRPPSNRKPRNYWQSSNNLRNELVLFWKEHNVPIDMLNPGKPPPIPSEHILNFFKRYDLRGAIASNGGREQVSYVLGGAKIIPGRWKEAVMMEEVKYLLPLMDSNVSLEEQTKEHEELKLGIKNQRSNHNISSNSIGQIGNHSMDGKRLIDIIQQSPNQFDVLKPEKEFWTKEKAVLELYRYLGSYKNYRQRPSVWMPQLVELSHEGYAKLFNTCRRYTKLPCVSVFSNLSKESSIENMAGLIPFKEWRFFDSQLSLFIELKQYLELYHNGSEEVFPDPLDVKKNGCTNLHHLIRIHGGKVLLAQKLSMKLYRGEIKTDAHIDYGQFTLDFAISLLNFIRSEFMTSSPPLAYPMISMPLEQDLLRRGHDDLASLVMKFGGYESVARRLGLAYFDSSSRQMEETAYKGARYLWKQRNALDTAAVLTKTSSKIRPNSKIKRRGVAWSKDIVVDELHAYVEVNMTKRALSTIWMPRFSQLDDDDRADLKNAISRNGGQKAICKAAGLIPYSVWTKFESFRELVKELSHFMRDEVKPSGNGIMPTSTQLTEQQYIRLSELIRLFGGNNRVKDLLSINGNFDHGNLSLLIELTEFMHNDMMSRRPPFYHKILMPTRDELAQKNQENLAAAMHDAGGFELIANMIPGVQLNISDKSN